MKISGPFSLKNSSGLQYGLHLTSLEKTKKAGLKPCSVSGSGWRRFAKAVSGRADTFTLRPVAVMLVTANEGQTMKSLN
jgi:hypothetical protein